MKQILTLFIFAALFNLSGYGQANSKYTATLKNMFEVSGSEQAYQTAIKQIFNMNKQQYPNVPVKIWDELEQEFTKASIDDLTEMLVPVYSKYLTQTDLEELISFYNTPVGKKFAKNTPHIMSESMQVGQQWGMKIAQDFQKKLQERGF